MKNTYLTGAVLFLVFALLVCAASVGYSGAHGRASEGFSFAWGSEELSSKQIIDMSEIRNVDILCDSINVVLDESDGAMCTVKVYQRKNRKGAQVQIETTGDTLSVRREHNNYTVVSVFGFRFGSSGAERVEIFLPKDYHGKMKVETGSGNIGAETDLRLEDFQAVSGSGNIRCQNVEAGEIKASVGSGNISFGNAEGNRDISAGSGNIRILGGTGDTVVSTGSGEIAVEGVSGRLDASAGSGNIRVCVAEVSEDIEITTVSGNIKLEIPKESSFTYAGSSISGNIRTDFDNLLEWNRKRNEAQGSYGDSSGMQIHTQASSGNTTVVLR